MSTPAQPIYRGLAYIVGINDYDHVTKLKNAVNDAEAMVKKLETLNFYVMHDYDISRDCFISRQQEFCERLQSFSVGLFYFAGHGVECNGINYLLLKDSPAGKKENIIYNTFPLQDILNNMHSSGCRMKIQIFDACRANPFDGYRNYATQRLAPINAPSGTIVAYSTSPGEIAMDKGMGDNSIYTGALLQHMDTVGLPIEEFFKRVRTTVFNLTKGEQTSWEHTSLIDPFSFNNGMLIQSLNVGYPEVALKWNTWPSNSRISSLKTEFLSGTYSRQEMALSQFQKVAPNTYTREELFVLGRCILRAGSWNSFACLGFIEGHRLPNYFNGTENPLVDGMLYEIYFDDEGNLCTENYKVEMLEKLMRQCSSENVSCSFKFINSVLQPFAERIVFMPSDNPVAVNVDVLIEDREQMLWMGETKVLPTVISVKHEQKELLDDQSNEFWMYDMGCTKLKSIGSILCKQYCIPEGFLQITPNNQEQDVYLKGGLVKL